MILLYPAYGTLYLLFDFIPGQHEIICTLQILDNHLYRDPPLRKIDREVVAEPFARKYVR